MRSPSRVHPWRSIRLGINSYRDLDRPARAPRGTARSQALRLTILSARPRFTSVPHTVGTHHDIGLEIRQ
jgi:hypothetical protein